jgi:hypothetical protein
VVQIYFGIQDHYYTFASGVITTVITDLLLFLLYAVLIGTASARALSAQATTATYDPVVNNKGGIETAYQGNGTGYNFANADPNAPQVVAPPPYQQPASQQYGAPQHGYHEAPTHEHGQHVQVQNQNQWSGYNPVQTQPVGGFGGR